MGKNLGANVSMIRLFSKDNDLGVILDWFGKRRFPAPDPEFLPPTGVIASWEGKPVACGFLFKTDAKVAMVGNLVTNPEADADIRHKALNQIINVLGKVALDEGFRLLTCATNIDKLGHRFEDLGFEKTDVNVSHFRRDLCLLPQHS